MVLFSKRSGQTRCCAVLMEEQQSPIGSEAAVPNHCICLLPVWLPYTYASFGQHKLCNRKSIIISPPLSLSLFLSHLLTVSRAHLPHTYQFSQMKNVKGGPPCSSMPGRRKISPSSSMRHSVQGALSRSHI